MLTPEQIEEARKVKSERNGKRGKAPKGVVTIMTLSRQWGIPRKEIQKALRVAGVRAGA